MVKVLADNFWSVAVAVSAILPSTLALVYYLLARRKRAEIIKDNREMAERMVERGGV